jgi:hypothetical protein
MPQPRHDDEFTPSEDETDIDTDSQLDRSNNDTEITSEADTNGPSHKVDSGTDDKECLFDNEVQHL